MKATKLDIALVDLYEGLRTVHVAAEGTRANFVLSHAAEKCAFANKLALENKIKEVVHTNVQLLDKTWAKAFVVALRPWSKSDSDHGGFPL